MHKVYRIEVEVAEGIHIGPYLAEFHTSNQDIKTVCQYFRSKAPYMPEPEHPEFKSGIPYCYRFGCDSALQLFQWFGYNKQVMQKVLTVFKLNVYIVYNVIHCDSQVAFDEDNAILTNTLSFEDFLESVKWE